MELGNVLCALMLACMAAFVVLFAAPIVIGGTRVLIHSTHLAATTPIECVFPEYDQPKYCPK